MEAQGIKKGNIMLLQDNMSAILLERNGMVRSGKRIRHLSTRAFWIEDQMKKEMVNVEQESTDDMVADFFTKPLQDSVFRKFRKLIPNEA